MDPIALADLSSLTVEQLRHLATSWSLEQWRQNMDQLTAGRLEIVVPLAAPEFYPKHWKNILHAIVSALAPSDRLEAVGRAISCEQMCEILSWVASQGVQRSKLFSLFIGMSHEVFLKLLVHVSPEQQKMLRLEADSEPIQHHMMWIIQLLTTVAADYNEHLISLVGQLEALDLVNIGTGQIVEQEKRIEGFREQCLSTQRLVSKALSIAWNTNRTDMIEKLGMLKEQMQKLATYEIGLPGGANSKATGLYEVLKKRLDTVFIDDEQGVLNRQEPILDALVRFSIWYLHDYWKMGLLPEVTNADQLELDSMSYTEQDSFHYRQHLFAVVANNLGRIGLHTMQDLILHKIYSKAALKEYVQKNLIR